MSWDFFAARRRRNDPVHGKFRCLDCGAEWGEAVPLCTSCGATKRVIPVPLDAPAASRLAPLKSAADLRKQRRAPSWDLGPEWAWLGRLPTTFDALLWGPPGGGKSSLATMLADRMAAVSDSPVLYVSTEEGTGDALLARLERLEVVSPLVLVSSAVTWAELTFDIEQADPRVIVLDSLTHSQVTERQLAGLKERRDCVLIVVAHATKEGQAAGSAGLAHWVDLVVEVAGGVARTTKNRFGALAEYRIFGGDA